MLRLWGRAFGLADTRRLTQLNSRKDLRGPRRQKYPGIPDVSFRYMRSVLRRQKKTDGPEAHSVLDFRLVCVAYWWNRNPLGWPKTLLDSGPTQRIFDCFRNPFRRMCSPIQAKLPKIFDCRRVSFFFPAPIQMKCLFFVPALVDAKG